MRIKFWRRKSISRLTLTALIAFWLFQSPVRAHSTSVNGGAFTHPDLYKNIWVSQLAHGQTLRYSLAFLGRRPGSASPNDAEPQFEPLHIQVRLLAADGSTIGQKEATTAAAEHIEIFDFDRVQIDLPGERRTGVVQVRLEVTVNLTSLDNTELSGMSASNSFLKMFADAAEIIDNASGRTTVNLGGGFNGTILDDTPGNEHQNSKSHQIISAGNDGIFGITSDQSLLVSALNIPDPESQQQSEPFNVQVKAYDKDGNEIAVSDEVQVLSNHLGIIRFGYDDLDIASEPAGGRKQVRLRMFAIVDRTNFSPGVQPILPPGLLFSSFAIVDNNTGATRIPGKYLTLRPRPSDVP